MESFLSGLKWLNAEELLSFFAKNTVLIDAGKGWNHEEICKGFGTLFVPYAKKNASYVVEGTLAENKRAVCRYSFMEECPSRQQTTCLDAPNKCCSPKGADDWKILLAQVTPVQPSYIAHCQAHYLSRNP